MELKEIVVGNTYCLHLPPQFDHVQVKAVKINKITVTVELPDGTKKPVYTTVLYDVPAWREIEAVCLKTGQPLMYRGDLNVDWQYISQLTPETQFGWAIRKRGTHLVVPGMTSDIDSYMRILAEMYTSDTILYYWWTGKSLVSTTNNGVRSMFHIQLKKQQKTA